MTRFQPSQSSNQVEGNQASNVPCLAFSDFSLLNFYYSFNAVKLHSISFPSIASIYNKTPIVFVLLKKNQLKLRLLVFSENKVWLQSEIHLNFSRTSLDLG